MVEVEHVYLMVFASLDSDASKMQTESQTSTESEALLHPGNAPVQNEDGGLGPSTPPNNIVLQQPGALFCLLNFIMIFLL